MKKEITAMQIEVSVKKELEKLKAEHDLISIGAVVKKLLKECGGKLK